MRRRSFQLSGKNDKVMNIIYSDSVWGPLTTLQNIRFSDYEDECMSNIKPTKKGG